MNRKLTARSTLETLKKEAKRWLKMLQAGDGDARRRLLAATPAAPAEAGLRDVQLALAREYGFSGWVALCQTLEDTRRSHGERVELVLRSADWAGDHATGARLLARWREIGHDSLYAAAATGDLAEVKRRLATDPGAASRKGGPLDREPLLYLAYSRMLGGETHSLEIARLLLDHGADPNAHWVGPWGEPAFTVLTGVIGQGEGDQPPHPQAEDLAALLIERGADPFDAQALYNTSITRDDTAWLDFLWTQSERHERLDAWRVVPQAAVIGGNVPLLNTLDYLLGNATAFNHLRRAEWLLAHGADPNSLHAYSGRPQREEALIHGHIEMAEQLERFGAEATPLEGPSAFRAACMRLDRELARAIAANHPEYLRDPEPMLIAARAGRAGAVALLLELGVDVDVADEIEQRGLQVAVAGGSLDVVKLLVAHGANIDRPTTRVGDGAMGYAAHFDRREVGAYLAPLSHDVHNLTYLGFKDRLAVLFAADPSLVNARHRTGCTPLFCLPADEEHAMDMAAFLLDHGANPSVRDLTDGLTAEENLRKRGLIELADFLSKRSVKRKRT